MNNYFVVTDIHGDLKSLLKLLTNWDRHNQKLIIMGDLIDRGNNSLEVIRYIMDLIENYDVEVIGGNHEELFIDFLKHPVFAFKGYIQNGGYKTLQSFLGEDYFNECLDILVYDGDNEELIIKKENVIKKIASDIESNFKAEINFIKEILNRLFIETEKFVFVHAGVDLLLDNWKKTSEVDFRWIREDFIFHYKDIEKYIVFGHTPVSTINKHLTLPIWRSFSGKKIGIDGGCGKGGKLLGVHLSDNLDYMIVEYYDDDWELQHIKEPLLIAV